MSFCPILTFCFKFGELEFLFIDFNFTTKISFDTRFKNMDDLLLKLLLLFEVENL